MTEPKIEVVAYRRVYKGRVLELVVETLRYPERGVEAEFTRIVHPGAAAIVPLTEDGEVILVRQYRHALGASIWEIPAGTRDPAEPVEMCAARELTEETGYRAERLEAIGRITPVPGYCNEEVALFLATGLFPDHQLLDADELLSVERLPFSEALAMVQDGRIHDAKTIAGLFLAAGHLGKMTLDV